MIIYIEPHSVVGRQITSAVERALEQSQTVAIPQQWRFAVPGDTRVFGVDRHPQADEILLLEQVGLSWRQQLFLLAQHAWGPGYQKMFFVVPSSVDPEQQSFFGDGVSYQAV